MVSDSEVARAMQRLLMFCVFFIAVEAGFAQEAMRSFIVTDMEGVGSVNNQDEQLFPGQRRFDESRRLLTGEVNAAVSGALEGGAAEIVIWDAHDSSRALSIDE